MDQIVAPSTNSGPTRTTTGDSWNDPSPTCGAVALGNQRPAGRGDKTRKPARSMVLVTCQALLQGISATLMWRLFTGALSLTPSVGSSAFW